MPELCLYGWEIRSYDQDPTNESKARGSSTNESGELCLAVEKLEGGGEDGPDVRHVDEHQWDPHQGIEHRDQLAQVRAGSKITIAWHYNISGIFKSLDESGNDKGRDQVETFVVSLAWPMVVKTVMLYISELLKVQILTPGRAPV